MTVSDEDLMGVMREGAALGRLLDALTAAGASPEPEGREGLFGPSMAVFGGGRTYRYLLTRRWAPGPVLTWVMLNPSTADAFADDPTISRCWRRAARWGYGGIAVVNLFALRATDPRELRAHDDPIGPGNNTCLRLVCGEAKTAVAAWGESGWPGRASFAALMITAADCRLTCLGTTAAGHPRHPLYVRNSAELQPWEPSGGDQ